LSDRRRTDAQVLDLATISALVRSAHGANDSGTLLGRVCASLTELLGFERAGIARNFADDDPVEAIAAHGWPLRKLTAFAASAETVSALNEARQTGALVFTRGTSAVVVPLLAAGKCHGFLLADRGGTAFDLNPSKRVLLSTLGVIISALLEQATAYDDLLRDRQIKTDFIALASHEIRSPTAAVCGIAATLHTRGDALSADERRGLSRVLSEQGQRLHRLVDQLLDLSRLDAASIRIASTPLAVRARTDEIVRGVAGERADEIDVRIDPALLMHADADAFDHIVSNLITNALRYGRRPIAVFRSPEPTHTPTAVNSSTKAQGRTERASSSSFLSLWSAKALPDGRTEQHREGAATVTRAAGTAVRRERARATVPSARGPRSGPSRSRRPFARRH
jgi:signal transduction histidine kinase